MPCTYYSNVCMQHSNAQLTFGLQEGMVRPLKAFLLGSLLCELATLIIC